MTALNRAFRAVALSLLVFLLLLPTPQGWMESAVRAPLARAAANAALFGPLAFAVLALADPGDGEEAEAREGGGTRLASLVL